jgi:hypothetical protein
MDEPVHFQEEPSMSFDVPPGGVTNRDRHGAPSAAALAATREAARVAQALGETGHEVRFTLPRDDEHVRVEVRRGDGSVLTTLTPAQTLDFATGGGVGPPVSGEARWPWL